ncbi:MAG: hypothetical protein D6698_09740, partial [Gammaproteobacteria bacterium]
MSDNVADVIVREINGRLHPYYQLSDTGENRIKDFLEQFKPEEWSDGELCWQLRSRKKTIFKDFRAANIYDELLEGLGCQKNNNKYEGSYWKVEPPVRFDVTLSSEITPKTWPEVGGQKAEADETESVQENRTSSDKE